MAVILTIQRTVIQVEAGRIVARLEPVRHVVELTRSVGGIVAHETTIHSQTTAAATWTVTHNLQRYPSVTVVDTGGNRHEAGLTYVTNNLLTLTFAQPLAGYAYLN